MDRRGELREEWLECPKPERFGADHQSFEPAMAAHAQAVADDQDGYIDPGNGLFVMTAVYLRDRGWCCERGCRHCPYS